MSLAAPRVAESALRSTSGEAQLVQVFSDVFPSLGPGGEANRVNNLP